MRVMRYLVQPESLVFNSKRVNGFVEFINENDINQWDLLTIALEVVEQWTEMWDEDQGFGSSDGTYMTKEFIDNVIGFAGKHGFKMTEFTPTLSVVDYSEAEHHNRVQRMESGI
jgi:hypothetical protein